MVSILDHDGQKQMVYVTVDETDTVNRLFRQKEPAAIYYNKGKKEAYHWILNPVTIAKMQLVNK